MTWAEQELAALGRAIRQLREEQSISRSALAQAAEISRRHLDALEAGRSDPPFDLLLALADGLGIRPSALFSRAEHESRRAAGGPQDGGA